MRCSEFIYPGNIARCQHIKVNGIQCGSPALKRRKFCYFHHQWHQRGIAPSATSCFSLDLPLLEDANSIQVALMRVMHLLFTNQIDQKKAALLLYALQTASSNLGRTKFEPRPQQVVINPRGVPDTSLGDDAWYNEEFAEDEEEQEDETKTSAPTATPETTGFCGGSASGRTLTVGRVPARSLFRAVQCESISTGPDSLLWFSGMLSGERGEFRDASLAGRRTQSSLDFARDFGARLSSQPALSN